MGRGRFAAEKGLAGSPFELGKLEDPFALSRRKLNASFRLGVEQGVKLRACAGIRYSMANMDCVVRTPVNLKSHAYLSRWA